MYHSDLKKQNQIYNRRSFFLLLGKLGFFSLVGWRLFDIQILQSNKYKTLSSNNQINYEIVYPERGKIYDRNNILIASNHNTYDLYIVPEQTPNIDFTLNKLNEFVLIDFKTKRKVIELSKKGKKFQSIKILKNIEWDKLEVIEANKFELPGLHLQLMPQRIYPYHRYLSHILGYINQPSENDMSLPFVSDMPSINIGKTGIEKFLNENLIGIPGKREIEVNAFGREIREISKKVSIKGSNINISIDVNVQRFVHKEINKHKSGSVVLLDINSGEIISMVSIPDYNPNLIIKKPNTIYWNSLLENTLSPLTNRSIQGLYSPGSTFKMIVALAALSKGILKINDNVFCKGKIEYGDRLYHCWKKKGHGKMNIVSGIKESCDVFFYELAKKVGIDDISKMATEFSFGKFFNIGFENEKNGIMPSKKWKKNILKQNWYGGETLITAIGQGYVLSTPLQLAVMTARIASNGKKVLPTILMQNVKKKFDKINLQSDHIKLIKNSMYKVVNEKGGTAFKSKSKLYNISGKTGTSQVKKITLEERESEDFGKKDLEWKNKDHALFVGYMPSEKPKYAISVIVEHGGSGAATAAPIAKKVFDYIYEMKIS